jgi:cation diffusion facilitator family transporter
MQPSMSSTEFTSEDAAMRKPLPPGKRERGVWWVVLLTALMMVVEIVVGYATNSMALLADGWHMATHVGALGLSGAAYVFSRRFAAHRAFAFGTGKVQAIAGYTSALALGLVAVAMMVESVQRLMTPLTIDFEVSLPVAVVGLVVNLASVALLHVNDEREAEEPHHDHDDHGHGHGHGHGEDHNHQAALLHVIADALTSALAIGALLAGRYLRWDWLDAVSGIIGGLVILKWGLGLARHAAAELLDVNPSLAVEDDLRATLTQHDGARVIDLHIWPLGGGALACVVTLEAAEHDVLHYRERLARFEFKHLTVELRRPVGEAQAADG